MGLFNTLLGVRSQIEGFSTEVIGIIMAGYFAGLLLLIDQGATKLVVNFEKLDYLGSAGLDVLLKAARQLKGNSDELPICSLNAVVQKVFDISGFSTILTVTKTEPEALEGF
jgi:anti-anti-sigma regulatory factor